MPHRTAVAFRKKKKRKREVKKNGKETEGRGFSLCSPMFSINIPNPSPHSMMYIDTIYVYDMDSLSI